MDALAETLKRVEFLAEATPETLQRFTALGRVTDLQRGHTFWLAGTPPHSIVIPLGGEAETAVCDIDGRELIDRFAGPGDCLGLVSAMDGLPHPQDARVTRSGRFFMVGRAELVRFVEQEPGLRAAVLRAIGRIYRRALVDRHEMAFNDVNQRVARFLLRRACVRQDDGARVLVHATHTEIASRLGSVREVVARAFGTFAESGLVVRTRHGIFIADWNGLIAEARDDGASTGDSRGPRVRTERFFLPSSEGRRRRPVSDDAALCHEFLRDLTTCRLRGCPAAVSEACRTPTSPVRHVSSANAAGARVPGDAKVTSAAASKPK